MRWPRGHRRWRHPTVDSSSARARLNQRIYVPLGVSVPFVLALFVATVTVTFYDLYLLVALLTH